MSEETAKRKLTTIFYADVADYSRLTRVDEEGTHRRVMAILDDVTEKIRASGGSVLRYAGDAVLATFPSAVQAVEASTEIQSNLARGNESVAVEERVNIRVGINIGDVIEDRGEVFGDGVNLAARLESSADPGGISISAAVFEQIDRKAEATFQDTGEMNFKNLDRPVRVYRWHPSAMNDPATGLSGTFKLPDKPSIAVLPFDNMSNDPDQDFFADGISEDVITQLSNFESLFVIARNSSFAFKGQTIDVKEIGKKLGVRYVVEGSIRRAGNRVRITAQLIDAVSDQHMWADRYDRELEDIFAVQDEVTTAIVAAIEPHLASTERQRARRKPPESLDAWENYQRGLWHLYQYTPDDSVLAKDFFRRASALDPNFSSPYAGLAFTLYYDVILGFSTDREGTLSEAFEAGKRAVSLDENNPYAHVSLGRVHTARREHEMAIAKCEMAISLNPSYASAHFGRAHSLWHLGRPAEAIISHDEAMRLSPRDPLMWAFMASKAIALILLGRYEEALEWTRRGQQQPRNAIWTFMPEVSALGLLDRIDEAREALDQVRQIKPDVALGFVDFALPFEHVKDRDHFCRGLIKAGLTD